MIEKCLIFHMSKEECVEALSKHANITPVITSTGFNSSLSLLFFNTFLPFRNPYKHTNISVPMYSLTGLIICINYGAIIIL